VSGGAISGGSGGVVRVGMGARATASSGIGSQLAPVHVIERVKNR
jgi:hypothetical protein